MKQQIKALKSNLKEIARQIRNQKKVRKLHHPHHDKYEGDYSLLCLREEFRYKHVVYCLVRGRTLEQIDSGVRLDMDRVNWIIKTMQPESKEKLYVVVNETLTPAQQAVQSAHAVAEFMRKYRYTMWSNGYLILLKGQPAYGGNMRCHRTSGCEFAEFVEPDLNNIITAYVCFGPDVERLLKNHKLV
jgi:hypothetical protein